MKKLPKYVGNNVSVEFSKREPLILVLRYNGPRAAGDLLSFEGENRKRLLFEWLKSYLLDGIPPEKGTGPVYSEDEYRKFVRFFKSIEISVTEKRVMILAPMVPEKGGKITSPAGRVKIPFDCDFGKFEAAFAIALERAE